MAEIPCVPTTLNLNLLAGNIARFRVAPKDLDGALIDLTGFTGGTIYSAPQAANKEKYNVRQNAGLLDAEGVTVVPDAEGAIVELSVTNLANMDQGVFGLPASIVVAVSDGSDTVVAAQGSLTQLKSIR